MAPRNHQNPKFKLAEEARLHAIVHGGPRAALRALKKISMGRPLDFLVPFIEVLPRIALMKMGCKPTPSNLLAGQRAADGFLVHLCEKHRDNITVQCMLKMTAQHPALPAWCERFKALVFGPVGTASEVQS